MIKEIDKLLYDIDWAPDEDSGYMVYDMFYYLKYLYDKKKIDLDRIINCSLDEFDNVIKEEFEDEEKPFLIKSFAKDRVRVFEFIKNLDLTSYDSNVKNYFDFNLDNYYVLDNLKDFKNILSIFSSLRSKNISSDCEIDVIYEEHQDGDAEANKQRTKILELSNYNFEKGVFPNRSNKKYDLVFLDCVYGKDLLDEIWIQEWENTYSRHYQLFNEVLNHCESFGKAIIRIPFTEVSFLDKDILEKNIIEKVVYYKNDGWFEGQHCDENVEVFLILNEYKNNEEIEFINTINGKNITVSNDVIIKNNCNLNMMNYYRNGAYIRHIYDMQLKNREILKQIQNETKFIDKLIDEYDINDK